MEYKSIENLDKPLSRIIYGTSNPLFFKGEDCNDLLDDVLRLGITTFDTARVYGQAETVLGKWIEKRGNREKVVILSKGGHPALFIPRLNERAIRKDVATSLEELRTDYIDIYLLHRDNPSRPVGEFVEILNALHHEGKIGAFGGSNWTHTRIEEANEYAYKHNLLPFTVSSPYFGLADMKGDPFGNGAVSIAGAKNESARKWYEKNGVAVCPYSTLGSGFFSGRVHSPNDLKGWAKRGFATTENFERLRRAEELSVKKNCVVSQLALAWVMMQKINVFAIASSLSSERLSQIAASLDTVLTQNEADWLDLKC